MGRLRCNIALVVFILEELNKSSDGELSKKLFMGFGYNPDLAKIQGERLDILNFFSWMKRLQEEFLTKWVVYDASGYYIVNRTPQKKIKKLGEQPSAQQLLDVLVTEQERPKRADIQENCDLRAKYLQRIIEVTGIEAKYIDSRNVFRGNKKYIESLDIALNFVEELKKTDKGLVEKINPECASLASQFYLPLEIAEAVYLERELEVQGKFGPSSEEFFDQAILGLMERLEIDYQTIRCFFGPRRPGYLSDGNVIWTVTPTYNVSNIISSDSKYGFFVEQYIQPFRKDGESILDCVGRIQKEISGVEK